jgi:hypothetical protein
MTPRKGETPAEFARACGHGTPPPVLTIENGGWQDNGNGGGDATRPILCTGNSFWNSSAQRYATDPEYRQKIMERERKRYARQREP